MFDHRCAPHRDINHILPTRAVAGVPSRVAPEILPLRDPATASVHRHRCSTEISVRVRAQCGMSSPPPQGPPPLKGSRGAAGHGSRRPPLGLQRAAAATTESIPITLSMRAGRGRAPRIRQPSPSHHQSAAAGTTDSRQRSWALRAAAAGVAVTAPRAAAAAEPVYAYVARLQGGTSVRRTTYMHG